MFGGQKTIYDGRLAVSKVKLIQFLDNDLNQAASEDVLFGVGYPPITHFQIDRFAQKYGEDMATLEYIENMINSVMGKPIPGNIFSHTYWHGDIQITWGWLYLQIDGDPVSFADAHIELYPSNGQIS